MKNSTLTTGLIAVAMMSSATLLSAHTGDFGNAPAQAKTSEATILLAQTKTKKNRDARQDDRQGDRDDRQDTRKDCREAEGAGKDKRDCKQVGRMI